MRRARLEMNEQDFTLDFILDTDLAMANAIRRTMLSDIKSAVIDDVCFSENDSDLCDEMIASRLGLVPLVCRDLGAAESVEVSLDVVGPATVYSKSIRFSAGAGPGAKAGAEVSVADPDIILVKLRENCHVKLRGALSVGTARKHAKYDVCCGTSYKQVGPSSFKFHVETCGSMAAADVFTAALDSLGERLVKYR